MIGIESCPLGTILQGSIQHVVAACVGRVDGQGVLHVGGVDGILLGGGEM